MPNDTPLSDNPRGGRAITDASRGITPGWPTPKPPETLASLRDAKTGGIVACDSPLITALYSKVGDLPTGPETWPSERQMYLFDLPNIDFLRKTASLANLLADETPCLFHLLKIHDWALNQYVYMMYPRKFIQLAEAAVQIADRIITRTQKPYQIFMRAGSNPPLHADVLKLDPMPRYLEWTQFANLGNGRAISGVGTLQPDQQTLIQNPEKFKQQIAALALDLRTGLAEVRITRAVKGARAPVVARTIQTLRTMTFADAERGTRARFKAAYRSKTIHSTLGIIIYNSVYSVVLDRRGEPKEIPGVAPYGMLLPTPKDWELVRRLQSPGLYLSLGPLASYQLRVDGPTKVQSLVFGSAFGLQQNVFGHTREELGAEGAKHRLQNRLHDHLVKHYRSYSLAFIVMPEAFNPRAFSFSRLQNAVYAMIPLMSEFVLEGIKKRLNEISGDWKKQLGDIAETIIREVIKDQLREIVIDAVEKWAVKKLLVEVGTKLTPGVNLIFAIKGAFDDEEAEKYRNVIGCLVMATRGGTPDDLTISSKILSKIAVKEIEAKVVEKVTAEVGKQVSKAVKSKMSPQAEQAPADTPADAPAEVSAEAPVADAPSETTAPDVRSKPLTEPGPKPSSSPTPKPPADALPKDMTPEPPKVQPIKPEPKARPLKKAKPASGNGTDDRKVDDRGVEKPTPKKRRGDKPKAPDTPEATATKGLPEGAKQLKPGVLKRTSAAKGAAEQRRDAQRRKSLSDAPDEDIFDKKQRALKEVYDAATEGTGAGQKPHEIRERDLEDVQGIGQRGTPGSSWPKGMLTGELGEYEEQYAKKIEKPVPDYREVYRATKYDNPAVDHQKAILKGYAQNDRLALNRVMAGIGLTNEGLAEVNIPVHFEGSTKRRYDRVYAEGDQIVLVEAKKYDTSTLTLSGNFKKQLEKDAIILKTFDKVRAEIYIDGAVDRAVLDRLAEINDQLGAVRYTVRQGPNFDIKDPDEKKASRKKPKARKSKSTR